MTPCPDDLVQIVQAVCTAAVLIAIVYFACRDR